MNNPHAILFPSIATCILAGISAANDTLVTTAAQTSQSGKTIVRTGDIDGDGRADIAESDGLGVRWISSASGAIVRTVPGGVFPGDFVALADAGDLDGDGVSDLAVGYAGARAYSGATGQLIWQVTSASWSYGHAIARIDDRDGDGRAEILVGVPQLIVWGGGDVVHISYEGDGRAEILSGANGALLATIAPPTGTTIGFGGSLTVVDDLDADGIADFAIAPFFQPTSIPGPWGASGDVRLISSATLATIGSFPIPPGRSTRVTALGDIDGDGIGEIALARIWDAVEIVSPATGATLRTHTTPALYDRIGECVVALGDVDGDSVADYTLGFPQPAQTGLFGLTIDSGPGYMRVYSGATGAPLYTLAGTDPFGRFGWSLASLGDVNGDGIADLAVGSPQAPRLRVMSGSTSNSMPNPYCVGGIVTGSQRAQLTNSGTTSVAANDLTLVVTSALPTQSGLFIYAHDAAVIKFGAGWRCVGSPFFRLGPVLTTSASGSATRALDLNAPPASGSIGVGTTAYFQFLFRDLQPNHGGRNASSALAITFTP